jgi:alkylation response protein AidB-like acyl-CoA dehydrogenase
MTGEQAENVRMLRDSAAAVAPEGGSLARIRALRFGLPGIDRAVWQQMAGMGWLGLLVPEDRGGAGLGMVEGCALAEALAEGLTPEPLALCASIASLLPADLLDGVLSGGCIALPAWQEAADTVQPGDGTAAAGGRVTGRKLFVPMAAAADLFLVAAGPALVLVEAGAPGVVLETAQTQDGGHFGTLTLDGAPCRPVEGTVADAIEAATLLTAAGLLGVMERSFALTLDYLRTRKQFGRAIGSFQALQHRAADLKLQIALTRASVEGAAALLDREADPARRRAAVSRAKARAATAAILVTREAIQMHGGIGYTDEYDVGLYLRRAMVMANQFGSARLHRARFAATMPEMSDD